jgi:hypothetical protein
MAEGRAAEEGNGADDGGKKPRPENAMEVVHTDPLR